MIVIKHTSTLSTIICACVCAAAQSRSTCSKQDHRDCEQYSGQTETKTQEILFVHVCSQGVCQRLAVQGRETQCPSRSMETMTSLLATTEHLSLNSHSRMPHKPRWCAPSIISYWTRQPFQWLAMFQSLVLLGLADYVTTVLQCQDFSAQSQNWIRISVDSFSILCVNTVWVFWKSIILFGIILLYIWVWHNHYLWQLASDYSRVIILKKM